MIFHILYSPSVFPSSHINVHIYIYSHAINITITLKHSIWLVVLTILKNISDYPIYIYIHILWKIKNVWNHQPAIYSIYYIHSQKRLRSLPPRDLSMVWRQKCLGLRPAREIAPKKWWMKLHFMWFTGDLTNQNGSLLVEVPSLKNNMPTKIVRWFTQPIQISNRGSDGTCAFQTLAIAAEPHFPVL